jgi:hypothetical protein
MIFSASAALGATSIFRQKAPQAEAFLQPDNPLK